MGGAIRFAGKCLVNNLSQRVGEEFLLQMRYSLPPPGLKPADKIIEASATVPGQTPEEDLPGQQAPSNSRVQGGQPSPGNKGGGLSADRQTTLAAALPPRPPGQGSKISKPVPSLIGEDFPTAAELGLMVKNGAQPRMPAKTVLQYRSRYSRGAKRGRWAGLDGHAVNGVPKKARTVADDHASAAKQFMVNAPAAQLPMVDASQAKPIMVNAPAAQLPMVDASQAKPIMVNAPAAQLPVVDASQAKPIMVNGPAAQLPVADASQAKPIMVNGPAAQLPVADASQAKQIMVDAPAAQLPVADANQAKPITINGPAAQLPLPDASQAKQIMVNGLAAQLPLADVSTARQMLVNANASQLYCTASAMGVGHLPYQVSPTFRASIASQPELQHLNAQLSWIVGSLGGGGMPGAAKPAFPGLDLSVPDGKADGAEPAMAAPKPRGRPRKDGSSLEKKEHKGVGGRSEAKRTAALADGENGGGGLIGMNPAPMTGTAAKFSSLLAKVKRLVGRMRTEEHKLIALGAEGWRGASREKVQLKEEIKKSRAQMETCREGIRECLLECDEPKGYNCRIPKEAFDSDGEVDADAILCSLCSHQESYDDNDIILCDGSCNRAYHEKCFDPPLVAADLPEDEGWLCPASSSISSSSGARSRRRKAAAAAAAAAACPAERRTSPETPQQPSSSSSKSRPPQAAPHAADAHQQPPRSTASPTSPQRILSRSSSAEQRAVSQSGRFPIIPIAAQPHSSRAVASASSAAHQPQPHPYILRSGIICIYPACDCKADILDYLINALYLDYNIEHMRHQADILDYLNDALDLDYDIEDMWHQVLPPSPTKTGLKGGDDMSGDELGPRQGPASDSEEGSGGSGDENGRTKGRRRRPQRRAAARAAATATGATMPTPTGEGQRGEGLLGEDLPSEDEEEDEDFDVEEEKGEKRRSHSRSRSRSVKGGSADEGSGGEEDDDSGSASGDDSPGSQDSDDDDDDEDGSRASISGSDLAGSGPLASGSESGDGGRRGGSWSGGGGSSEGSGALERREAAREAQQQQKRRQRRRRKAVDYVALHAQMFGSSPNAEKKEAELRGQGGAAVAKVTAATTMKGGALRAMLRCTRICCAHRQTEKKDGGRASERDEDFSPDIDDK
eukprot:gene11453-34163_t